MEGIKTANDDVEKMDSQDGSNSQYSDIEMEIPMEVAVVHAGG